MDIEKVYKTFTSQKPLTDDELNEFAITHILQFCIPTDSGIHYIFKKKQICDNNATQIQEQSMQYEATKRFVFKNSLVNIGVAPNIADDWIKVRKAKKAAQTETAFNMAAKQIHLVCDAYGVSPTEVVYVAVLRNWQGIQLSFYENINWEEFGIKRASNQPTNNNQQTLWEE